jgi:hypothetical protein
MLYWLVYQQGGVRSVLIIEASSLLGVRLRADVDMPGLDQHFVEGHEFDGALALRIPEEALGRMMAGADAANLIERIELGDPIPMLPPSPRTVRPRPRLRRHLGVLGMQR